MRRFSPWALCALVLLGVSTANAQVVISQVYGGGGNSGATLTHDFIELFNRGTVTVDLTGWSVQYASSAGSTWTATSLSGSIAPGRYYLIQQAKGSGGTQALPPADASGGIAMAAGAGKVALVSSTTRLSGTCPTSGVVDFVGFGSAANCYEGSGPTATLTNTTAAHRVGGGCTDTDNNAADFSSEEPAPRNSSSPATTCAVGGETMPTATGTASPASLLAGSMTGLSVEVTPGTNPDSTGILVTADLTSIGGAEDQPFVHEEDDVYVFDAVVASGTTPGQKTIDVTVSDAQGRSAGATITLRVESPVVDADHVVISQVYGGGGNLDATYNRDFVELYNPTDATVDMTGWTLQYASATGSVTGSNNTVQPIGGLIGPGEYFLVAMAAGTEGDGADLPDANILGATNLAAENGKIALVSNAELLAGTCPIGDADIIDYVGYGSANCSEGDLAALSAGNSIALFRRNGGSVDTDVNRDDFARGAPAPRRTAPIMEIGPAVLSTNPGSNGFNAPRDASITITFTEPVLVDGTWFSIACETTGAHDEYTIAGGGRTWVITPNVNFLAGERCEVTIFASAVRDEDTDDADPGTDNLPGDRTWSFTIATGAAPVYAADVHLMMGNPSGARNDIDEPHNYLMEKPEFALSYHRDRGIPNWVSWHLSDEWVGSLSRFDTFRPDPAVPPFWYRVQELDYSGSGFDRGHLVPNADRDHQSSIPINQATFLMTNMMPQAPDNNQGPWANFENHLRTLLPDHELYVVAGGAGTGGQGFNGPATHVAEGRVTVPAYTWKAVLVLPKLDGNDVARVDAATHTIAVILPNVQGIRTQNRDDWRAYLTTVDEVEALTGFDLFDQVAESVQNGIEAGVDGENPPGTADQAIGVTEDSERSFVLDAVSPGDVPMSVTLVSNPTRGEITFDQTVATYTPEPDFNGEEVFSYTVSDGNRTSNPSTVTLVVMEINDSPVAGADSVITDDDETLVIDVADLLTNDTSGPANESDQTLTVVSVAGSEATHGTVTLDGPTVTYVPAAGFSGAASFTYEVCDDGSSEGASDPRCATGAVAVTVTDSTAPVISDFELGSTSLWPVNHRMVDVAVSYSVHDTGDPAPACAISIFSNEPENGTGDGDTGPDHEVVDDHLVRLRAERSGTGDGRIYTVTLSCSDASGNESRESATVSVDR